MKRGDVWWMQRPGRKARPVCILTRDEAIPALHRIVVAEGTTRIRGLGSEIELNASDGMPRDCVLSFDNVNTVAKNALTQRITELSPARMHEVCEALAFATGC